jgi:hypothetical protein
VQIRHREWDLGEPKLAPIVHQSRPIAKGEDGIWQEGHLPPLTRNAPSARIGVRSPDASKRGNKYLRRQLIHGARAALPHVAGPDTPLGRWAKALLERAHPNVAICGVRQRARQDRLGGATARRKVRRQGTALGGGVVGRGRAEAR